MQNLLTRPIKIIIPGVPVSGSQLKFNRTTGSAYRPKEHKQRVFTVSEYAERALQTMPMEYKHELPYFKKGTALYMQVSFYMPYRSADYRTGRNAGVLKDNAPMWVIGNKDLDNMLKPLKDGLKGIVYNDDKQIVCYGSITKQYSESPRTEIEVGEI